MFMIYWPQTSRLFFTTPEGPGPVVAVDNTFGIRQAFEHLLEYGHEKIAFGEHRRDGGMIAMQKIIDGGAEFTAVIASNDLLCLGAIQSLEEAGRLIPEDVAVIGFDDILDARSLSPSLTNRFACFADSIAAELFIIHSCHFDLNVDSIKYRTRNAFLIFGHDNRRASAGLE